MLMLKLLLSSFKGIFKRIEGDELEAFLDRGGSVEGVRYPTAYVRDQAEAWGLYIDDKLVGGYLIVVKGPFRTTIYLKAQNIVHHYRDDELIELGGVWIEEAFRSKKYSTSIWLHMVSRIQAHSKPYVIFGYNLSRSGLQKLYAAGNPHILFRGAVSNGEIRSHSTASIEVINASSAKTKIILKAFARIIRLPLVKSKKIKSIPDVGVRVLDAHEMAQRVAAD